MTEPTIRQLVRGVVDEARALVLDLEARGKLISKHYRYPQMAVFEGGLPNIRHVTGPPDWSEPFKYRGGGDYDIAYDQVTSLSPLVEHVLSTPRLAERILLPGGGGDDETRRRFNEISVSLLPLNLLDRLILRHGGNFDDVAFATEWAPLERWLEGDGPLSVEVVVPLAMVTCERENVQLAEDVGLLRLADDEQRARVPETVRGAATHPCVLAAATHALVFAGRHIDQKNRWLAHTAVPDVLETTPIDRVVQALQLAAGLPLGYAQVYLRPVDWAWDYDADLPPIIDTRLVRRYPPAYNDAAWNRPPQVLTAAALDQAPQLLAALDDASPRLTLAARRYGQAQLRDEDEDAVLDACIALEAAFGDSQPTEMTYKISMRTAALLADEADPERIRTLVSRLYGWRSKIAHGDDPTRARRKFVEGTGLNETQASEFAVALVGRALAALLKHPDAGSGADLDALLIRRRDDRPAKPEVPNGSRRSGGQANS